MSCRFFLKPEHRCKTVVMSNFVLKTYEGLEINLNLN